MSSFHVSSTYFSHFHLLRLDTDTLGNTSDCDTLSGVSSPDVTISAPPEGGREVDLSWDYFETATPQKGVKLHVYIIYMDV